MDCVILAAHNEEQNIGDVLRRTKDIYNGRVIVVDDGSNDRTLEVIHHYDVELITYSTNLGKGFAMLEGCKYAIATGATKIILMDSDGQHDPLDIPMFFNALNGYDVVLGYRNFSSKMPFIFRLGNWGLRNLTYLLFKISLRDTQCGFRAFHSKVFDQIKWTHTGYFMESEMVGNITKHKLKHRQIEIMTCYKDAKKGTNVSDGIHIGLQMLKTKMRFIFKK